MSVTTNIYQLIKSFALHQNTPFIHFLDFSEYMRRYAQKHVDTEPELSPYLSQTQEILHKEIGKLSDQKKIILTNVEQDNKKIIVPSFFTDKFSARYNELQNNSSLPFPQLSDLPKQTPPELVDKRQAIDIVIDFLENRVESNDYILYGLILPKEMPILLFPANTKINQLLDAALGKIRQMLRKEEYHDYFLKKLKISNPGKEISVKNFFSQFISKPGDALESLKASGEAFYFWSQLCFFIRQDYDKVKDYTQEDISVLQSVYVTEIAITFYKNKAQQDLQRLNALKNLEQILNKPPLYFNKEAILKFVDTRGIPLLGQYTEEDLNNFLHEQTTTIDSNDLPPLLIFKIGNDSRYYIYKTKVIPLIIRLCSDARDNIRGNITKEWFNVYKNFDTLPEMGEQKEFEKKLEKEVRISSPVLYALLNSSFLSLVHYESRVSHNPASEKINLFANGKLLSYSELLLMSRQEIATDAKILLPFWYTVPIISWIAALFLRPSKKNRAKVLRNTAQPDIKNEDEYSQNLENETTKSSHKEELIQAAKEIEKQLVPEESTLERELSAYIHQWNRMLDKKNAATLTEDVNSLIRDYMRKTIRSLQGSSFNMVRIQNLAETLAKTPSLSRIKDQNELIMYIELYILKLVKNL